MGWIVHKFGGSSLADADCFRRVASIVAARQQTDLTVVVSAMGGMTDQLLGLIDTAAAGRDTGEAVAALRERYERTAAALLSRERAEELGASLERDLGDIRNVLNALSLVRSASHRSRDLVSGFGEIWSARLLTALLQEHSSVDVPVMFINARDVLMTGTGEMGPIVLWAESGERLGQVLAPGFHGIAVVTGYIASDRDGLPTTLGRNGSDFSASIFAALLGASELNIWTDVDGVMSGDPRRVPEATVIDQISYNEAMELAYFGAKVIHPQTMAPAVTHDIPIRIRNTFNPDHPGTRIASTAGRREAIVKAR